MSISTAQLNPSHSTLEEIALSALPLLQALGLEVEETILNKACLAPVLPNGKIAALPFGIEDFDPSVIWK
jgi:hypothetical protein